MRNVKTNKNSKTLGRHQAKRYILPIGVAMVVTAMFLGSVSFAQPNSQTQANAKVAPPIILVTCNTGYKSVDTQSTLSCADLWSVTVTAASPTDVVLQVYKDGSPGHTDKGAAEMDSKLMQTMFVQPNSRHTVCVDYDKTLSPQKDCLSISVGSTGMSGTTTWASIDLLGTSQYV